MTRLGPPTTQIADGGLRAWELQLTRPMAQVLRRLELETRAFHRAADEGWLALTFQGATRHDYVRQLAAAYGFEAPLEAAFAYTPRLPLLVDLRRFARAGLLAQDLLALGIGAAGVSHLPQCAPIAPFATPIEALGWMFVRERSSLLHDTLRSHIREHLAEATDACAYLTASANAAGGRLRELGAVLDHAVQTERQYFELLAASHAGLRCLVAWSSGGAQHARKAV